MGNFINQSSFTRLFYSGRESSISNVGYHDFSVVLPETNFRTQNSFTWHFVLSGSGVLEIYEKEYKIKGGEMFFIPPHTKMRYYPDKNDPWEYVWFTFKDESAREYSQLVGFSSENPVCECESMRFQKIEKVLKKLFNSLTENEGGYFRVLSAFYEIMEISTTNSAPTGIRQVKKLLDENFATQFFSIEQLCFDVGISHAHLLRLFKEAYGVTIVKYIIKKRIELACELLLTTDLSVSSVAYSCGFSDEIHFMKTFKREIGKSALKFRREGNAKADD